MATYHTTTYTHMVEGTAKSIPIKYFVASNDEISVYGVRDGISGSAANNSNIYGVNGTFFQLNSHQVYGVAVNNGNPVNVDYFNNYGGSNNHPDLDCFLFGIDTPISGSSIFLSNQNSFPFVADNTTITMGDAKWAIGGHNLHLHVNFSSSSAFYNNLSSGVSVYGPENNNSRTFVGCTPNGNLYICSVTSEQCNLYDEYKFLKHMGCTLGLNLDGGGSAFISHKNGYSANSSRAVPTVLRVNY